MGLGIVQVDAFTGRSFAGNPAAVCVLDGPAAEDWMQAVAREMNLSETAFLAPGADGWEIRWFTPAAEVDLCGHATLAAAHVLAEQGRLEPGATVTFGSRSGPLRARRLDEGIELDFPVDRPRSTETPPGLVEALGAEPLQVLQTELYLLAEMADAAAVRALRPDFRRLAAAAPTGLTATAPSDDPAWDFVSRFFAPALGIDEDPVTGSAHCSLAPFWSERLGVAALRAFQASARGGELAVRLEGERVRIAGRAVTVLRGELTEAACEGSEP